MRCISWGDTPPAAPLPGNGPTWPCPAPSGWPSALPSGSVMLLQRKVGLRCCEQSVPSLGAAALCPLTLFQAVLPSSRGFLTDSCIQGPLASWRRAHFKLVTFSNFMESWNHHRI